MKTLDEFADIEDIKDFLLYHMDSADDRKSKVNPILTKQQVWDVNMSAVLKGNITRVNSIIVKNITKEFGKHYE